MTEEKNTQGMFPILRVKVTTDIMPQLFRHIFRYLEDFSYLIY